MATRAVSTVVTYRAWNTTTNLPATSDSANHTLRWIKDGTSAAPTNAGAITEVDSTNAPGVYKITLTSTETDCTFGVLTGKSSTSGVYIFGVQIGFEYVPTSSTTFGAFIGNATAALAVDASGRVDVSKIAGTSQTARDIGASVLLSNGTGTGQVSLSSGTVTVGTNNDKTGYSLTQSFPTNFSALAITAGGAVTVGTNNDKTGYTASTVTDKTGYALTAAYDPAKTAAQAGDAMTLTSAYDYAKGTVAMTESYAANGAAPTPIQAIYAIHQNLMSFAIAGTAYTVKKLDGSTTAFTVTLNDATSPTGATR